MTREKKGEAEETTNEMTGSESEVHASEEQPDIIDSDSTLANLENQLEQANEEIEKLRNQYLRTLADLDNYRKRIQKERQDLRHRAVCDVVKDFLPVIDNLERAMDVDESSDIETVLAGVRMTYQQFLNALELHGVSCIKAQGEQFDPHHHEAVEQVELPGTEDEVVVEEIQRGYLKDDRVIRPSRVKVNRKRSS